MRSFILMLDKNFKFVDSVFYKKYILYLKLKAKVI